jgi:thymidine kinase
MEPIGDITKIIPLADEVIKLNAYCVYCKNGTLANFTKREYNLKNSDQILVGSNDLYSPCCRYHFLM